MGVWQRGCARLTSRQWLLCVQGVPAEGPCLENTQSGAFMCAGSDCRGVVLGKQMVEGFVRAGCVCALGVRAWGTVC